MGKSKGGSDGGGAGGGGGVPRVTLEQFAEALCVCSSGKARVSTSGDPESSTGFSNSTVSVSQWSDDSNVYLLHFASGAAQKDALGRCSLFLEDLDLHGTIVEFIPTGQRGGVANYSGHNMRVADLCRFLNLLRVQAPGGKDTNDAENALVECLVKANVMRVDKTTGEFSAAASSSCVGKKNGSTYSHSAKSPHGSEYGAYGDYSPIANESGYVIAAVAGSSDKTETRNAVLHEAMHMIWYGDGEFAERCYEFWQNDVTDEEKKTWTTFLSDLKYNTQDLELVVNELQAYMCTERQMFGGGFGSDGDGKKDSSSVRAVFPKSNDCVPIVKIRLRIEGNPVNRAGENLSVTPILVHAYKTDTFFLHSQKQKKKGSIHESATDSLASLQKRFALKAKQWVPKPPSVGVTCKVVWQ
jgi:hypothetical protein